MEFVILTGLSGAGKTRAMHAMEDIGFYCVDNLPPALIPVFYDLCDKSEGIQRRVAVVTDTRGGELFKSFFSALETLKAQNDRIIIKIFIIRAVRSQYFYSITDRDACLCCFYFQAPL